MLLHCIDGDKHAKTFSLLPIVDDGLTSTIALAFAWCSLADAKLVNMSALWGRVLMLGSFVVIFAGYIYCFYNGMSDFAREYLYMQVVLWACVVFVVIQFLLFLIRKSHRRGWIWALLGSAAGGIGYFAVRLRITWLCVHVEKHTSPMVLWCVMLLLLLCIGLCSQSWLCLRCLSGTPSIMSRYPEAPELLAWDVLVHMPVSGTRHCDSNIHTRCCTYSYTHHDSCDHYALFVFLLMLQSVVCTCLIHIYLHL